jgi:Holliday junction resolvase RusA-like endonuclease
MTMPSPNDGYSPADYGLVRMFTIKVDFKLISKSNHKGMSRFLPEKYRHFEEAIAWLGVQACKRPRFASGWVVLRPHFKTKVHQDLANLDKSLLDGLVKGEVFEDDKDVSITVVPAVYGDFNSTVEIWALPK